MASRDDDVSMRSVNESTNSESSSERENNEWLVTTRKKRSTAGNRLSTLIQQAAAEDDELELLFAEDENDEIFEDVDTDASDSQMDSSDDDDDDQGPAAGAEELEGEKELQAQERAERRAKKRKLNDPIPTALRKRVKIDPTTRQAPPQPKKKTERMSWIRKAREAPTRASSRRTTKLSKEQLQVQMRDRERRRLRQREVLEKSAKRKQAAKLKTMTQDERLAEAERVEMKNARSLNSWEEAEKIREEEQRAKLAALHSRKLEGPVITWWSGVAEWVDGKLKRVGKTTIIEEREKKERKEPGRRRKAENVDDTAASVIVATCSTMSTTSNTFRSLYSLTTSAVAAPGESVSGSLAASQSTPSAIPQSELTAKPPIPISGANKTATISALTPAGTGGERDMPLRLAEGVIEGNKSSSPPTGATATSAAIEESSGTTQYAPSAASLSATKIESPVPPLPSPQAVNVCHGKLTPLTPDFQSILSQTSKSIPQPNVLSGSMPGRSSSSNATQISSTPGSLAPPPRFDGSTPLPGFYGLTHQIPQIPQRTPFQITPFASAQGPTLKLSNVVEYSTRNCLILENFDEVSIKSKDIQCQILFNRKFQKASKPHGPIPCAITAYPAKFRDPTTGLYYFNSYAYKEIQRLKRGDYCWSTLLQAYVGQTHYAARGVPQRFLQR